MVVVGGKVSSLLLQRVKVILREQGIREIRNNIRSY